MKYRIILALGLLTHFLSAQEKDSLKTNKQIDEVVITGTLKAVTRDKSPVPVEIYTQKFFQKNPTSNLLDAVSLVNGIRSQVNCSVCNTSDIHINGLEGPYTLVLIDGMPIVSALSTVYGLTGIPNSMIDRVEIVKGPASSLYGTEAMGGIINVITKNALTAPKFVSDFSTTSWGENNSDLGFKFNLGRKIASMLSVNYFSFQNRIDRNKDNFVDTTLQNKLSIFNKWNFKREDNKVASLAFRYFYEDRLGGELQWQKKNRGGDEVYGESIYTNRFEAIGMYQLPTAEDIFLQLSYNYHHQDSRYGEDVYDAIQSIAFGQLYWNKTFGKNEMTIGATLRNNYYDDSTVGTLNLDGTNHPRKEWLPGVFAQNQWNINDQNTLLLGYRLDYSQDNGLIHSPRVAYKLSPTETTNIRASFGTGFRVVNVVTEDHKALTGARETIIKAIKPEKSYNGNIDVTHKILMDRGYVNLNANAFYSYFTNKIIADLTTNSKQIIFDNIKGHAISQGVSAGIDVKLGTPLSFNIGATYMDVFQKYPNDDGEIEKEQQQLAPKWSGTYSFSYEFSKHVGLDFTGEIYGPMKLITVENDFRPEYSPWYCLSNVQLRTKFDNGLEIYGGIKNLFDFTPKNPILFPQDPFGNRGVQNPNGYEFDPAYGYAPMQRIRGFLGVRYTIK